MANSARVDIIAHLRDQVSRGLTNINTRFTALNKTINILKATGFAVVAFQIVQFTKATVLAAFELGVLADKAENTTRIFDRLARKVGSTGTVELAILRESVDGAVSDLELMQRVGAAVDAGLSFEQSRIALQFLRLYSLNFGKDFKQLMATVFTGLQRGSTLMLDDAGIIISQTDDMFKGMNDLEKKTALVGEAIKQMAAKMPTLAINTEGAAAETSRLAAAYENLRAKMGKNIAPAVAVASGAMADFLDIASGQSAKTGTSTTAGAVTEGFFRGIGNAVLDVAATIKNAAIELTGGEVDEAVDQLDRLIKKTAEMRGSSTVARPEAEGIIFPDGLKADIEALSEMQAAVDVATAKAALLRTKTSMDADEQIINTRLKFLNELEKAEIAATGDTTKLALYEVDQWEKAMTRKAFIAEATEAEITRIRAAAAAQREIIEGDDEVRKVMLIFTADASQVKTEADLAAYSLGLLVNQLGKLHPAIGQSIGGIEQIVTGIMAGRKEGVAGVIGGSLAVMSAGLSYFSQRAAEAERERRRLTEAIADAANVEGSFADQLKGGSLVELQGQFVATIASLRNAIGTSGGRIFGNVEKFFIDVAQTIGTINDSDLGKNDKLKATELVHDLDRISDAISNFGGGASTFAGALENFNHLVNIDTADGPAAKLALLGQELAKVGIDIANMSQAALEGLDIRQHRRLVELIHDLNSEIAAEELSARKDQAKLVIENIKETERVVKRELDDLLAAQKTAAQRSVSAGFDIQEVALRQSFVGRFKGAANDPLATLQLLQEAQNEIDLLALSEQAALVSEFAQLNAGFEAASAANEQSTQVLVQAVNDAAENQSVSFAAALAQELNTTTASTEQFLTDLGNTNAAATAVLAASVDGQTVDLLDRLSDVRSSHIVDTITNLSTTLNTDSVALTKAVGDVGLDVTGAISGTVTLLDSLPIIATSLSTMSEKLGDLSHIKNGTDHLSGIEHKLGKIEDTNDNLADIKTNTSYIDDIRGLLGDLEGIKTNTENLPTFWDKVVLDFPYFRDRLNEISWNTNWSGGNIEAMAQNMSAADAALQLIQTNTFGIWLNAFESNNALKQIRDSIVGNGQIVGGGNVSTYASSSSGQASTHTWHLTFHLDGELAPESLREAYRETIEPLIEADLEPGGRLNIKAASFSQ